MQIWTKYDNLNDETRPTSFAFVFTRELLKYLEILEGKTEIAERFERSLEENLQ